jgi:hypothetical protein
VAWTGFVVVEPAVPAVEPVEEVDVTGLVAGSVVDVSDGAALTLSQAVPYITAPAAAARMATLAPVYCFLAI